MVSANAGQTLVTQPAYEKLKRESPKLIEFAETELPFKHQGNMLAYRLIGLSAYRLTRTTKAVDIDEPAWFSGVINPNRRRVDFETELLAELRIDQYWTKPLS